jgi:hypothetical protein
MNKNLKQKCNFILKQIIVFTVIFSCLKIVPSNEIILTDKILIILIVLSSFFIINNYLK